jgi:hypothetical protein
MARTFAALLVDSDLKGLEALVYGFQGADWRITACPAPETAAFLVKASAADIVVVASREPQDKALALARQLRSQDDTRSLPLLVLGPFSQRARFLEIGGVDFLCTPVFVRDVITASRIATARDAQSKIDGSLTEFSLLSLLRSMSSLGSSGVLQVERAGRRGEILFSEGELTGAQLGALQGSAALHHLLMWEDGKINLGLRVVGRRAPVNQRFDQVIDEAERFLRDYSHAISGLGCSSTIYTKNEAKLTGPAQSFPSEVMPIVRLCDGHRTLADLIDQSPFRVFDTIRILARLIDLGVITRRENAVAGVQPTQDLQKFWESARIASPGDDLASAQRAARANNHESRVGEPNRRKLRRRERAETPVLGTPLTELVEANPPSSQSAAVLTPPVDTNKGKERTSGVLQTPTGERRQTKFDRRERPSFTIDVGLVEATLQTTNALAGNATTPTPKVTLTPAMGNPVVTVSTPAKKETVLTPPAGLAASPALAPVLTAPVVAEPSKPRTGRITGTLLVPASSANRRTGQVAIVGSSVSVDPTLAGETPATATAPSPPPPMSAAKGMASETPAKAIPLSAPPTTTADKGKPAGVQESIPGTPVSPSVVQGEVSRGRRVTGTLSTAPSQRTSVPKAPGKDISVQLDPVLVAEMDRLEKATVPAGPSVSSDAPTAPLKIGGGNRITGTLSTPSSPLSSHKSHKTSGPGTSMSFDPSLVQEAQKPAVRVSAEISPKTPVAAETSAAASRPAQPAAEGEGSRAGARISGAFSAVESDFFAREADLYKREGDDNFSDLDEPAGRSGSKGGSRRPNRR